MALNVGNIAASEDFDSAISVADADAYFALRGNTAWAAIDPNVKAQLTVKATDYIRGVYGQFWCPSVIALAIAPKGLREATAELAFIANTMPLLVNATRGKKRVKIGPLEVEYDGDRQQQTLFIAASLKLAPYLCRTSGAMVNLVRS